MDLNLPILDQIANCKNLLIAGMGGGFDIFCGLPIYFELRKRGFNVHLANFSFTPFEHLSKAKFLTDSLVGITADVESPYHYSPERYLAKWFRQKRNEEITIWCFENTGVRPLLENYQTLMDHLEIDGILLIDGGVDSLLRGDEAEVGTILEDTISLIAVSELKQIPVRLIACVGMGAEIEIAYAQIFENIAKLVELDAFIGVCSLNKRMTSYQDYEDALLFVQSRPAQEPSVINSSVISAVQGKYGDFHLTSKTTGSHLSISPLMSLYWFFELPAIARRNLLYSDLRYTDDRTEAYRGFLKARRSLALRKPSKSNLG